MERVVGEVVRLVHDDEVEREIGGGLGEIGDLAEQLEGDDGVGRAGERRLDPAERLDPLRGEEREERVELVEQLGEPLEGEVLRDHHEHALGEAELLSPAKTRPASTVFPRPTSSARTKRGMRSARMRPAAPTWCGRTWTREERSAPSESARRSASKRSDPGAQGERGRGRRLAGGEGVERARGGLLDGRVRGDLDERGIAARDDGDPVAPGEADREPPPLVGDLHDDATPQPRWARWTTFIPVFQAIARPLTIRTRGGPARPLPFVSRALGPRPGGREGWLTRGAGQARNPTLSRLGRIAQG